MIPHTRSSSQLPSVTSRRRTLQIRGFCPKCALENAKSPTERSVPSSRRSAELSSHESRDPSTEVFGFLSRLGLSQNANDGLCAGGTHEDPASIAELGVETGDLLPDGGREHSIADGDVFHLLGKASQVARDLGERATVECGAEQERGNQPVAGHVAVEPDQVTGLLATEDAALAAKRLEDITVADVGRDDANAIFGHQPVEPHVRHHGHGHELDVSVESEHPDDLVAVDDVTVGVHGEHAVAVAVEGHAEVEAELGHGSLKRA